MKNIVIKYGIISGLCMAVLLFISIPVASNVGYNAIGMVLFIGKIAAFIPIYFAIRYYRKTEGNGMLTFFKGFNIGILIVVITSLFYALSWIMLYYWVTPDFPDKYFQDFVVELKLHGAQPKDITEAQAQFEESKKILANPFINFARAFTDDQLEYGIIMTLIFALILRKKPPTLELENIG